MISSRPASRADLLEAVDQAGGDAAAAQVGAHEQRQDLGRLRRILGHLGQAEAGRQAVLGRRAGDHPAAFAVGVSGADQRERLAVAGEGHPGPRVVERRGDGRDRNLGHGLLASGATTQYRREQ